MILDDFGQLKIVFFNHHVEMLTPPSLMVDHNFPDLNRHFRTNPSIEVGKCPLGMLDCC